MIAALVLVACFVVTPALARAPKQAWQWRYQVWMPPVYQRIAWCESGSRPPADPIWTHHGGLYEGAFGFHRDTWRRYKPRSYPAHAYDASPWMQYRVALILHRLYGFTPWGCWLHNAWVRG